MWFSKYAGLLLAAGMVVPDILVVQARGLNPELVDMNRRMANNVKSAKKESGVKGPREPKYFHEPGKSKLGHYDSRFYDGVVSDEERTHALKNLIRAWLQWTQSENLETWLAHGTLLGWWWNSQILPWDTDLDVQVSESTLATLANKYNQTTWTYNFEGDILKGEASREYLLDVNPYWVNRNRGVAANLIDGRWIDKNTGLFIDITGLSETQPQTRPGVVMCKNLHKYHLADIYPLRETAFENTRAFIPYLYDKVLVKEYRGKALTLTEYEGHVWQPAERAWIKKAVNTTKTTNVRLRNGKTIKVRVWDPMGLDAVPQPSFGSNIWRLVGFWS